MGHRLSKIYTRTGDDGTTGLGDGARISKDSVRVEAYGAVDELNSVIGMLLARGDIPDRITRSLTAIQHRLFDLGGELSIPGRVVLDARAVEELEKSLDAFNTGLEPLREFVLPGGTGAAAYCHFARAICRRAERRTWTLAREEDINPQSLKYLNRLSDLLFVIARLLNQHAGHPETLWQPAGE